MTKPTVAVLIPQKIRGTIFSPETEADLASFANVVSGETAAELPTVLRGAVACLTGWGTPSLTAELVSGLPDLQLVAHTAGSIHKLVDPISMEAGLHVSHAAAVIADSVAELVVGQALRYLRQLDALDIGIKTTGGWLEVRHAQHARLLGAQVVGVVGTGHVGRTVISRLQAFGSHILAADPFLTDEKAAELGVERVELDELFQRADIVTLHAPALPETEGLVNAARLAMLHDGALLINMSRGTLVIEDDLEPELRSGRLFAILDVFATEPLPADSPIRSWPNVYLSPHAAGYTTDAYLRQGQAMVDEVRRLVNGEPLKYEVPVAMLATMA